MNHLESPNGAPKLLPDLAGWGRLRETILQSMELVMGRFPLPEQREPPAFRVLESADCGIYLRQAIEYQTDVSCWTPAYLLLPKATLQGKQTGRAVVCLHPTDFQNGYGTVVGRSEAYDMPYATELAEMGVVALAPAYPLMAGYEPDLEACGCVSGTMKAIVDNMRGIDLLESLPYVDEVIGALGHSLGGHNALFTSAWDKRIAAVVSNCGMDSFREYGRGDITGWTSQRYMPRLKEFSPEDVPFDFHDVLAAICPRRCLVIAPSRDDNFQWNSAAGVVRAARRVFSLHGVQDHLRIEHPDLAHEFPSYQRQEAYRFLGIE